MIKGLHAQLDGIGKEQKNRKPNLVDLIDNAVNDLEKFANFVLDVENVSKNEKDDSKAQQ